VKSKSILVAAIALLSLGLSSCGSTGSSSSTNLVCASIESYLSTKALALVDAARGGSARESVDVMVGGQLEVIDSGSTSKELFDSYLSAMSKWAGAVDQYQIDKQAASLTEAAMELESRIDALVPTCESKGWRFESGWRG
jgi:hypothetical protein